MYEFYSKKYQEYILEQEIYNDIYQYKNTDNITLKMLSSMILNNNINLFKTVLQNQKIFLQERKILLTLIAEEGDSYLEFALELLKDIHGIHIRDEELIQLINKSMNSNSIELLTLLFKCNKHLIIDTNIINISFNKNPNIKLLIFLCEKFNTNVILNSEVLTIIMQGDYIELFKYFTNNNKEYNWSILLNMAIKINAYEIIDYILTQIESYKMNKEENYYDQFFDLLITEKFEKIINFLNKCQNLLDFGRNNLEKLLLSFQDTEHMESLLFKYHLSSLNLEDKSLKSKVDKFILNNKLQHKLLEKKQKKEIKKI